jgi:hypothetical protein
LHCSNTKEHPVSRFSTFVPTSAVQEQVSEVLTGVSAVLSAATLYIALALVF